MTTKQKELYIAIARILWEDWDPIGVNEFPEANDEYEGYTPSIFCLVVDHAEKETIALKLHAFEKINMGLPGDVEHCLEIAEKIISVRNGYN
jgi:hypothetical protein